MQTDNLRLNSISRSFVICFIMLLSLLILDVYIFPEKSVLSEMLITGLACILTILLIVPSWVQVFKSIKQSHKNN